MDNRISIQEIPDRRKTTVGGLDGLIREHAIPEDTLVSVTIINSLFNEDFVLGVMKKLTNTSKKNPRAIKVTETKRLVKAGLRGVTLVQGVYLVYV